MAHRRSMRKNTTTVRRSKAFLDSRGLKDALYENDNRANIMESPLPFSGWFTGLTSAWNNMFSHCRGGGGDGGGGGEGEGKGEVKARETMAPEPRDQKLAREVRETMVPRDGKLARGVPETVVPGPRSWELTRRDYNVLSNRAAIVYYPMVQAYLVPTRKEINQGVPGGKDALFYSRGETLRQFDSEAQARKEYGEAKDEARKDAEMERLARASGTFNDDRLKALSMLSPGWFKVLEDICCSSYAETGSVGVLNEF